MQPSLLLNASFEPLKVVPWRRAVILLLSGKAEVVEAYEDEVHSVSLSIRLPSVLRMTRYIKVNRLMHAIRFSRNNIFIRDSFSCQYCGDTGTAGVLTLDHVIPVSFGGRKDWRNMVTACKPCNQTKGGRTPMQAGMRLIRTPLEPTWNSFYIFTLFLKNSPDSWKAYIMPYATS